MSRKTRRYFFLLGDEQSRYGIDKLYPVVTDWMGGGGFRSTSPPTVSETLLMYLQSVPSVRL